MSYTSFTYTLYLTIYLLIFIYIGTVYTQYSKKQRLKLRKGSFWEIWAVPKSIYSWHKTWHVVQYGSEWAFRRNRTWNTNCLYTEKTNNLWHTDLSCQFIFGTVERCSRFSVPSIIVTVNEISLKCWVIRTRNQESKIETKDLRLKPVSPCLTQWKSIYIWRG